MRRGAVEAAGQGSSRYAPGSAPAGGRPRQGRALDATRDYLRGIVLDARDIGEEASARAGGGGGGGGRREGSPAPETMASEFFYCLALGGMLR